MSSGGFLQRGRGGLEALPEIGGGSSQPLDGALAGGTPWLSGLMIGVVLLTPILAYLGNLAFAPLVALAGLACLPVVVRTRRAPSQILLVLLALLAWALVTLAWSPATPTNLQGYKALEGFTALKLVLQLPLYAAFVMAAGRVSPAGAARALLILAIGLGLVALVAVVEGLRDQALYMSVRQAIGQGTRQDLARRDVARAVYPLVLLIWPCLLILRRRWWAAALLAVASIVAALLLKVDAPIVALAVGAVAGGAVLWRGRAGVLGLMTAAAAYVTLAPLLIRLGEMASAGRVAEVGKASWSARVQVWNFVVDRIFEKPLFGWGVDASRTFIHEIPLHPHDASLQIWMELGAPGAALAALAVLRVFTAVERLRRSDAILGASAAACATAYLVIGALSFGVWQEWWLALGALAAATIKLAQRARSAGNASLA